MSGSVNALATPQQNFFTKLGELSKSFNQDFFSKGTADKIATFYNSAIFPWLEHNAKLPEVQGKWDAFCQSYNVERAYAQQQPAPSARDLTVRKTQLQIKFAETVSAF